MIPVNTAAAEVGVAAEEIEKVEEINHLRKKAVSQQKVNRAFFNKLRRTRAGTLDGYFRQAHDEVFSEINCLNCANCCKTTSPIFMPLDITRISSHLKMSAGDFERKYLKRDEVGDMVLQQAPCPFLGTDNQCSIYAMRPKACREYPHTNRKRMHQALKVTERNLAICPAVDQIIDRLKEHIA